MHDGFLFAVGRCRARYQKCEIRLAVFIEHKLDEIVGRNVMTVFATETDGNLELAHGMPEIFPCVPAVEMRVRMDQLVQRGRESGWRIAQHAGETGIGETDGFIVADLQDADRQLIQQ